MAAKSTGMDTEQNYVTVTHMYFRRLLKTYFVRAIPVHPAHYTVLDDNNCALGL